MISAFASRISHTVSHTTVAERCGQAVQVSRPSRHDGLWIHCKIASSLLEAVSLAYTDRIWMLTAWCMMDHCQVSLESMELISHLITRITQATALSRHLCTIVSPPSPLHLQLALLTHNRIILSKVDTHAIDTMPLISRRSISLSLEHMTQMTSTIRAYNLSPLHSKRLISMSRHSSWNSIEERRPPTT